MAEWGDDIIVDDTRPLILAEEGRDRGGEGVEAAEVATEAAKRRPPTLRTTWGAALAARFGEEYTRRVLSPELLARSPRVVHNGSVCLVADGHALLHTTAGGVQYRGELGEQLPAEEAADEDERPLRLEDPGLRRFFLMFFLTGGFMVIELVCGIAFSSLALISDSYHMLSDVFALAVGFYATVVQRRRKVPNFTFGMSRADAIGALINAAALLGLSLNIALEGLSRLFEMMPATDDSCPDLKSNSLGFLAVATTGLIVNLLGLFIFSGSGAEGKEDEGEGEHGHAHGEGEHGHAHGAHGHAHTSAVDGTARDNHGLSNDCGHEHDHAQSSPRHGTGGGDHGHAHFSASESAPDHRGDQQHAHGEPVHACSSGHNHGHGHGGGNHGHGGGKKGCSGGPGHHGHSHADMNAEGVMLHIAGDLLGSVGALVAGLCVHASDSNYSCMADPLVSMFICAIIVYGTVPLLRRSMLLLMERAPNEVDVESLERDLRAIDGVEGVHSLRVWELAYGKPLASVHLHVQEKAVPTKVIEDAKVVLCRAGITTSTVQPEQLAFQAPPGVEIRCHDPVCEVSSLK